MDDVRSLNSEVIEATETLVLTVGDSRSAEAHLIQALQEQQQYYTNNNVHAHPHIQYYTAEMAIPTIINATAKLRHSKKAINLALAEQIMASAITVLQRLHAVIEHKEFLQNFPEKALSGSKALMKNLFCSVVGFAFVSEKSPEFVKDDAVSKNIVQCLLYALKCIACFDFQSILFSDDVKSHVYCCLCNLLEMAQPMHPNLSKVYRKDQREMTLQTAKTLLECFQGKGEISANMSAAFLPGVVSATVKILLGDSKQGTKVFVAALQVFGLIVVMALNDQVSSPFLPNKDHNSTEYIKKILKDAFSEEKNVELGQNMVDKVNQNVSQRTEKWFQDTSSRITKYILHLFRISKNEILSVSDSEELKLSPSALVPIDKLNWDFRYQQVKTCFELLSSCRQSLSKCSAVLFESLLCLTQDDHSLVRSEAQTLISGLNLYHFHDKYEDSLRRKIAALPRILGHEAETTKLQSIRLIIGLLDFFPTSSHPRKQFISRQTAEQICNFLWQCLELDLKDNRVVERSFVASVDFLYECRFEKIRDYQVREEFLRMIRSLSVQFWRNDLLHFVFDIQIGRLSSGLSSLRCEVLLLLEVVICSTYDWVHESQGSEEALHDLMLITLEEVSVDKIWNANKINWSEPCYDGYDVEDLQLEEISSSENILMIESRRATMVVALAVRLMGQLGKRLKEAFPLVNYLYPLLEKLGDENVDISSASRGSLQEICASNGYKSLEQLTMENADYFVDAVSFKLKYSPDDISASMMLQALLRHSTGFEIGLSMLLKDLLKDVLNVIDWSSSDQSRLCSYVRSLSAIITYMAKNPSLTQVSRESDLHAISEEFEGYSKDMMIKYLCEALQDMAKSEHLEETLSNDNTETFVPPHLYNKPCTPISDSLNNEESFDADSVQDDDREEDDTMEDIRREEEAAKPTDDELLLDSALRKCLNFLNSKNSQLRFLSLDVFYHGLSLIAYKENVLLPLIAQLWEPLKLLFKDCSQRELFQKTFDLVEKMGEIASRFLSRRLRTELWPVMKFVMKQLLKDIDREGLWKRPQFELSLEFEILKKLLLFLVQSSQWKDAGWDMLDVTRTILRLILKEHSEILRQLAVDVLIQFSKIDPDLIWSEMISHQGKNINADHVIRYIDDLSESRIEFYGQVF